MRKSNFYIALLILVVIPLRTLCQVDSTHLFVIKKNGQFGFIDSLGNIIIEPQFQDASNFSEGLSKVKIYNPEINNFAFGFIDQSGKFVIKADYEEAGDFSEGVVWVKPKNYKWDIDTFYSSLLEFINQKAKKKY